MEPTSEDREIRAKYLDWSSARLADGFLALTPDEIYELAERASHGREDALVASAASGPESTMRPFFPPNAAPPEWRDPVSFPLLVARVTEVLSEVLHLPTLEEWAAAYRKSPAEYDAELLGFWKESL